MRDRKNIKKVAVSREKVLISSYGNGRLRGYLPLAAVAFSLLSGVIALQDLKSC